MFFDLNFKRVFARLFVEDVTIICHGLPYKPGSIIEKSYNDLAKYFAKRGLNTLIFDFSGTGKSSGTFKISNWIDDLANIVKNFKKVDLVGFSMGGVIATYVAANSDNINSLTVVSSPCCAEMFKDEILDAIYLNAREKGVLKVESYENFVNNFKIEMKQFEPIKWIDKVNSPVLIVHGTDDKIVEYENAEILFNEAKNPKKLLKIEGNHFLRHNRDVINKIVEWIYNNKKFDK